MSETEDDAKECGRLIGELLTESQRQILGEPPVWDLDPPQREEYLSPHDYVMGLGYYADRVSSSTKSHREAP